MEQFIVSARKYRPNSFETLIGQDGIARTLKNSILRGQLAHAYLFCGPRGVGKTTTARIFAKAINCLHPGDDLEPCGKCESCRSFAEGRSYCIHELDAASNNSVDDIRSLTEMVRIPPQVGKYGVFIIDEVHMLSTSAFNAFLKTLEEPPAHAIFILATTEKHKILPTILSRCQTYDFSRISIPDIVLNLKRIAEKEGIQAEEDALHILAQKADGAMRDALTLFDQTVAFCGRNITYAQVVRNLNVLDYEYYLRLTDHLLQGRHTDALLLLDDILSKGFNALHFLGGLSTHLRDLLVCRHRATHTLLSLPPSVAAHYDEQAARCPLPFLYKALEITTACEAGYRQAGNPRLSIEFALIRLAALQTDIFSIPERKPAGTAAEKPGAGPGTDGKPDPAPVPPEHRPETAPAATAPETPALPPAGESAPAPAPATPATPSAGLPRPGGRSLKAMLREAEEQHSAARQERAEECRVFTEDDFRRQWELFAQSQKEKGRTALAAALLKSELIIHSDPEDPSATFFVDNASQQDWIRRKSLPEMEEFFRNSLKNRLIRILVELTPEPEGGTARKPYMPTEIARALYASHEELRNFKTDLDLEIK